MKRKILAITISLLMAGATFGIMTFPGEGIKAGPVKCQGLRRAKCRAKPRCGWVKRGRKGYCRRKRAAAPVCKGLLRPGCRKKAKCRWVRKSAKRRAYCRRR